MTYYSDLLVHALADGNFDLVLHECDSLGEAQEVFDLRHSADKMTAQAAILDETVSTVYSVTMFTILTTGLVGNLFTVFVLVKRPYRIAPLSPLMINLCVADIIICALGYPVAVTFKLLDSIVLSTSPAWCGWLAFINCFTGIASVGTLSCISWCLFKGTRDICPLTSSQNIAGSNRRTTTQLIGIWVYAFTLAVPPFFGWNRFVLQASGVSCHPHWASQEAGHLSYIIFLVILGFFVPLCVIYFCQSRVYRCLKTGFSAAQAQVDGQRKQLESLRRAMRVTCVVVLVFVVSWSPYCITSLVATFTKGEVLSPAASLIPGLMAKASVVYNPLVYTALNKQFRKYLCKLLTFRKPGESQQS